MEKELDELLTNLIERSEKRRKTYSETKQSLSKMEEDLKCQNDKLLKRLRSCLNMN